MTPRRWVALAAPIVLGATLTACSSGPLASLMPEGPILRLTAKNIAFDRTELTAPAGLAFGIDLVQQDPADITHDVDIRTADGQVRFDAEPVAGGQLKTYHIPALAPGRYVFICSIHPIPSMTGTLIVR
jgi:plastocyanin